MSGISAPMLAFDSQFSLRLRFLTTFSGLYFKQLSLMKPFLLILKALDGSVSALPTVQPADSRFEIRFLFIPSLAPHWLVVIVSPINVTILLLRLLFACTLLSTHLQFDGS